MQSDSKGERKAEERHTKSSWPPSKKDLITRHYKDFIKYINDIPFDKLNPEE
jgi:hypothetical protein